MLVVKLLHKSQTKYEGNNFRRRYFLESVKSVYLRLRKCSNAVSASS